MKQKEMAKALKKRPETGRKFTFKRQCIRD